MNRYGLLLVFVAALLVIGLVIAPSSHRPAAAQSATAGGKHAATGPASLKTKKRRQARPLRDRTDYWRQALHGDPPKVRIRNKRRLRRRQPRRRR